MSILFLMIPLSLALVVFAGWGFFWAVESGQFDDLESPAWEVLHDEYANRPAMAESSSVESVSANPASDPRDQSP